MSIEKTPKGEYRVRYREGSRNRSKVIGPRKADAVAFEQEIKRSQRLGSLADGKQSSDTLEQFVHGPWDSRHLSKKAPKTQKLYAYLFDKHIEPYLGHMPLSRIGVADIDEWLGELERRKVGRVAQQKALALCNQILNRAVRWEVIPRNPALGAERPKSRKKIVVPPTPLEVERIREALKADDRLGEATLVSVLAYAGLRPQEALALTWSEIGERTIRVHSPKTNANRSVRLLAPLAKDLAEWKLATGGRYELVFPNTRGHQWTEEGWSSWRERVWYGLDPKPTFPPKDCRHTFCSLLIREDSLSLPEQAQQAGHGLPVHLDTYVHVMRELQGTGSAEGAIRQARAELGRERRAV